jgi:MYXO-CTERM domain-containing protein
MMRSPSFLAGSLSLLLLTSTAAATVAEPDGTAVPKSSGPTGQLNQYFGFVGEPINWTADAASTPNAFSPLCGFTATFVLHGADCAMDFAWYNETGQPPQASDLHVIIPSSAVVGQTFTGSDIKKDPAYQGGLVGFALVYVPGQFCTQNHYSNPAYNQNCSGCSPAGHWITTLTYPSKLKPNAFYLAFEDGPTGVGSFNNDGDFNDDVYLIDGVTCVGGGEPCDTTKPGICASGITQCTSTGVVCHELSQPVPEKCNGLDDDCDGQTDEGDLCGAELVCDKGVCVQSCSHGEFVCPLGKECNADGQCVDPSCKNVSCPTGTVCTKGACKSPCDGVVCPHAEVCRVGVCVNPCDNVTCAEGQVCNAGVCVTHCSCAPCTAGKQCEAASGLCGDKACATVTCDADKHCAAGACIDNCTGAVCPTGQTCTAGECVNAPSGSSGSGSTGAGFGGGFEGSGGSTATTGTGTGTGGTGGTSGNGGDSGYGGFGESKSNCGCSTAGEPSSGGLAWAGLALAIAAARRRRGR